MKLRFEPRLVREWVLEEARRNLAFRQRCRQCLEPIYECPEEERAEGFALAYTQLFEERGLGEKVAAVLGEFSALDAKVEEVLVWQALSQREEDVQLSADGSRIGLRLRWQRLADPALLGSFLRRELMRITDLLDDTFGYRPEPMAGSPAEEGTIRQRYRLLWDITIDSRLSRLGRAPAGAAEERWREFERAFSFLPAWGRRQAFAALWQTERVIHDELLEWAGDPAGLLQEGRGVVAMRAGANVPIPGSLCPLCRFSTYVWANPSPEEVPLIQADFPTWTPEEGVCQRCSECYQLVKASPAQPRSWVESTTPGS